MDDNYSYQNVLKKVNDFVPVDWDDIAVLISNNDEELLRYVAKNDYKQVYKLLHSGKSNLEVGKNASFIPSFERVSGELKLLLVKKDFGTLNELLKNFVIDSKANNYTADLRLLKALESQGTISSTDKGYILNVQIS